MSSRPPSGRSRIQQGGLLRWWLEPYEFELQARGSSAGPASQRGQQQGLARGSLPPPMPGVLRLKGGQLASALVRPRRLREPGATPTHGVRAVPVRASKGHWVVWGAVNSQVQGCAKPWNDLWIMGPPLSTTYPKLLGGPRLVKLSSTQFLGLQLRSSPLNVAVFTSL